MVGDDQFSFPVVSHPVSHLMQSSPLWRISSRVYLHDEAEEKSGEKEEDTDSFYSIVVLEESAMEKEASSSEREVIEEDFVEEEEVVEENIDILWEDFFCKEERLGLGTEATEEEEEEEGEGKRSSRKQLCLPGGGVVALVAIVKLLKKMFLIRDNSAHDQVQVENKR